MEIGYHQHYQDPGFWIILGFLDSWFGGGFWILDSSLHGTWILDRPPAHRRTPVRIKKDREAPAEVHRSEGPSQNVKFQIMILHQKYSSTHDEYSVYLCGTTVLPMMMSTTTSTPYYSDASSSSN
jgi:hypothetical protein